MNDPPLGQPQPKVPWVTLVLVGLNLIGALLAVLDPDVPAVYALNPAAPTLLTVVASLFLHTNLIHLLGNMVFLAAVGPRVESAAGRLRFLSVYLAGGLVGELAHWLVMRAVGSQVPLLGASGAIAACAGYGAVRFMNRRVPIAPRLTATVGSVTLVWVALQAAGAFFKLGGGSVGGQAFWTHLAGFAAGIALSVWFKAPKEASLQFGHERIEEMSLRGPAALLRVSEQHLAEHPGDPKALRQMATALHQMGERDREAHTLTQLVDAVPTASQPAVLADLEACSGLGKLGLIKRLKLAESLKALDRPLAKRLLASVIEDKSDDSQRPDALLAMALIEEGAEQARWAHELARAYPLHAATEIARQKGLCP